MATDEQVRVLQTLARVGGNLTFYREGREPIHFRSLVELARLLQTRGFVRVMASETAAYVELTDAGRKTEAGRKEAEWGDRFGPEPES